MRRVPSNRASDAEVETATDEEMTGDSERKRIIAEVFRRELTAAGGAHIVVAMAPATGREPREQCDDRDCAALRARRAGADYALWGNLEEVEGGIEITVYLLAAATADPLAERLRLCDDPVATGVEYS